MKKYRKDKPLSGMTVAVRGDDINGAKPVLKKRMQISKDVGDLKEVLHMPVEDKLREEEIIDRLTKQAGKNLSEEQLIRIFTAVFKSSKQIQS